MRQMQPSAAIWAHSVLHAVRMKATTALQAHAKGARVSPRTARCTAPLRSFAIMHVSSWPKGLLKTLLILPASWALPQDVGRTPNAGICWKQSSKLPTHIWSTASSGADALRSWRGTPTRRWQSNAPAAHPDPWAEALHWLQRRRARSLRAAKAGSLLRQPTSAGAPRVRLREQIAGFAQTKKQKPGSRRKGCSPGNPFCLKDVEMLYVHVHFY